MHRENENVARIIGLGSYLPDRVLSNKDFESMVETTDEWITSRTGIKERRIAAEGEFPSHMGTAAAIIALKKAGITPDQVGLILVCTMTPDYPSPSTAGLIQHALGATKSAAVDIQAACTGFLYGLSMAKAYVESGMTPYVLVIASEKMSSIMDYTDRNTCVLFGDGAAAAVVAREGKGLLIDHISLGSDGELAHLVIVPGGGSRHPASTKTMSDRLHYFKMEGKEVFKHAVRRMTAAAKECLQSSGLNEEDLKWIVPHQANIRIIDAIAKGFNTPLDRVFKTVHKYGNTSASSVAIALTELTEEHSLNKNDHLLLVAFGGGLTWGATLLTQN